VLCDDKVVELMLSKIDGGICIVPKFQNIFVDHSDS
jgi:hypothetical protein